MAENINSIESPIIQWSKRFGSYETSRRALETGLDGSIYIAGQTPGDLHGQKYGELDGEDNWTDQNNSKKTNLLSDLNPINIKTSSKPRVKEKTQISLKSFKEMPEPQSSFKKAKEYAVFPNVGKGGLMYEARSCGQKYSCEAYN